MSSPTSAPYGSWSSPITAAMLATAGNSAEQTWVEDGIAYWLEARPREAGRQVVVKGDPLGEPVDVTPPGFNARTTAHEYGGGDYCVTRSTVIFSNFDDQRLYRQEPGADPVPITPEMGGAHRFADGTVNHDGRWWLGVRERHDLGPAPADVVNELVVVPLDGTGVPRVVASGRDFYSDAKISPDGKRVSYLAWDLPWMPWDGCEVFVADLEADGGFANERRVAGHGGEESIWQPSWAPDGSLVFASDRSGWWNLERIDAGSTGERRVLHVAEAEFGYPRWVFGERSFDFLSDGRIVCMYDSGGRTHVAILDGSSGDLVDVDLPYDALAGGPTLSCEGSTVVLVIGSATHPARVLWLDVATRAVEELRVTVDTDIDPGSLSAPSPITFPTDGGKEAHAFYYPPANPGFVGPAGERPPLLVIAHGGPTSNTTPSFNLGLQFWTSRGIGVVDVDYGGSTGYGREYRQRLNGNWGVVDLQDCVNAARYLIERGDADDARLLIRGGSAGGYLVICALTATDLFAAGASYFGIADLVPFAAGETHKFEAMYEHTLVGPWPEAEALYRARSPINAVDGLRTPMLVLQGADDEVVPPAQAELIVEALGRNHVPHAYLLFEGEGHGFRRAETIIAAREAELSFYGQVLGFEPADDIERLRVEHLAAT